MTGELLKIRDHHSPQGYLAIRVVNEKELTVDTVDVLPGFTWTQTKFPLGFYLAGLHALGRANNITQGDFSSANAEVAGMIDMSWDHYIQLAIGPLTAQAGQQTTVKFTGEDFRKLLKTLADFWCE